MTVWGESRRSLQYEGGFEELESRRFDVLRQLGDGGMGVVYEVLDRTTSTRVALKTLKVRDPNLLYYLKREFRALQDIDHPNLVRLGELIEEDGRWYLTMELVEGQAFLDYVRVGALRAAGSLATAATGRFDEPGDFALVRPSSPLPSMVNTRCDHARLRSAVGQLAAGLAALHDGGRVHRDVKPSNVLVTAEGRTVLVDFGLVFDESRGLSSATSVVGTAAYMAPEQAAGGQITGSADWYAVGVMTYEALTGRLPFEGAPLEILMAKQRSEPPLASSFADDVPGDLDALCAELLRFDPNSRANAKQILAALGITPTVTRVSTSTGTETKRFVGRGAELATLDAAYRELARGTPTVVALRGDSGVGKSALVSRFTNGLRGEESAPLVLEGRCYEREIVPYKGFDGVVDSLAGHLRRTLPPEADLIGPDAALVRRLFPTLGRVEAIARASGAQEHRTLGAHEIRHRAFAALRGLLAHVATKQPLIIAIDDIQWAGADSLRLLAELTRARNAPRILWLLTSRVPIEALWERADAAADFDGTIAVRELEVGALDEHTATELAEWLLARAGVSGSGRAQSIAAEAGGHPLYVDELVRHVAMWRQLDGSVRLDDAMWARINTLDEEAVHVLEIVCIAGTPLAREPLQRAADLQPERFARLLAMLRVSNLVRSSSHRGADHLEPYHDRVRDTMLAQIDEDTRSRHHERLALALEASGASTSEPYVVVAHWEAAGQPERAAVYAERAADAALEALAFGHAAELYATALRLGKADEATRSHLLARRADALGHGGKSAEAAEVYLEAASSRDPAVRLECRALAAESLLVSGRIERGLAALSDILAEVGIPIPTSRAGILSSLLWQRCKLAVRGTRWKPRHESELSSQQHLWLQAFRTGTLLGTVDFLWGAEFQARGLLFALRAGEEKQLAYFLAYEGTFRATQGQRGRRSAARWVAAARRANAAHADPVATVFILGAEGATSYYDGAFAQAAERLGEAAHHASAIPGANWHASTLRIHHVWAVLRTGALRKLRRYVDEYVGDAVRRGDRYLETTVRRSCNMLLLATEGVEAARRDLDRATWSPAGQGFHIQHWHALRARAEVALFEGEANAAREATEDSFAALQASLLTRVEMVRAEARFLKARLALASFGETGDRKQLAIAGKLVGKLARERVAYVRTWELLLRAGLATADARADRALQHLRAAIAAADAQGTQLLAAIARLRAAELGPADRDELAHAANRYCEREGILHPDRVADVLAPFPNRAMPQLAAGSGAGNARP